MRFVVYRNQYEFSSHACKLKADSIPKSLQNDFQMANVNMIVNFLSAETCFQVEQKEWIGNKWVNHYIIPPHFPPQKWINFTYLVFFGLLETSKTFWYTGKWCRKLETYTFFIIMRPGNKGSRLLFLVYHEVKLTIIV